MGPDRARSRASVAINATATALGAAGLVALLALAPDGPAIAGAAVYGTTLVLAYGCSALYHATRDSTRGRFFQTLDHCTIFLLIAGTYTPIAVLALWRHHGWLLLGAVWLLALAGIAIRTLWIRRLHRAAPAGYLLLGWIGLAWAGPLVETVDGGTLALLLAGGLAYTAGAAVFALSARASADVLWHLCAVAGSAAHYAAIVRLLNGAGVA